MSTTVETSLLDELLDSVQESFTPEVAHKLVSMRASPAAQARLEQLAAGNAAGQLTADEDAEYSALVHAGAFISLLQAKARRLLGAAESV